MQLTVLPRIRGDSPPEACLHLAKETVTVQSLSAAAKVLV